MHLLPTFQFLLCTSVLCVIFALIALIALKYNKKLANDLFLILMTYDEHAENSIVAGATHTLILKESRHDICMNNSRMHQICSGGRASEREGG